ncbi:unknown [Eggerthella sp. CAG:209]|nr:unknown [Eggerthella sp. CAG:209]
MASIEHSDKAGKLGITRATNAQFSHSFDSIAKTNQRSIVETLLGHCRLSFRLGSLAENERSEVLHRLLTIGVRRRLIGFR